MSTSMSRVTLLDLIQTMPLNIYLLPSIALLGFGPTAALVATVIFELSPEIRPTALGICQTPYAFSVLGQSLRVRPLQMLWKSWLPFAVPSVMAGIDQSLTMAFGMVIIAGNISSGGLGQTIYAAMRKLDIATSITIMVLDRMTQRLARGK